MEAIHEAARRLHLHLLHQPGLRYCAPSAGWDYIVVWRDHGQTWEIPDHSGGFKVRLPLRGELPPQPPPAPPHEVKGGPFHWWGIVLSLLIWIVLLAGIYLLH